MRLVVIAFLIALLPGRPARAGDLDLRALDGTAMRLPQRGSITVVQFMATWCAPCHEQTKQLVELNDAYAPRGVRVFAVSLDRPADHRLLPIYRADFAVPYPLLVGGTLAHLAQFGFGDTLPALVLFDRSGRVFDTLPGLVDRQALTTRLDWLTGDRQSDRPPRFVAPHADREEDELPHVHATALIARQEGRRPGSLVPS